MSLAPPPAVESDAGSGRGYDVAGIADWEAGFLCVRVVVVGGIAIDVLRRREGAWIPAGAGMTNGGPEWRGGVPICRWLETGDLQSAKKEGLDSGAVSPPERGREVIGASWGRSPTWFPVRRSPPLLPLAPTWL